MAKNQDNPEIIHDIEGAPFILEEKRYLPEHEFNLCSGYKYQSGEASNLLTKFILNKELQDFLLATLDKPCKEFAPPFNRIAVQKLRRRALRSPYKTYQEWIKNDCRPERVHFLVDPEKDTPQTITDFHGQTQIVYSGRRLKNGLPLFNGVLESKFHDENQHVVPRDILTPHIAAIMLDHPYSRTKVQEIMDLPRSALSNFKDLLNLNFFKDRHDFIAQNIDHILENDQTYKPPEVPDAFFNGLPRKFSKIIKASIVDDDPELVDWCEQCGREPRSNLACLKKIEKKINIKGLNASSLVHMYFILKDAGKIHLWRQEAEAIRSQTNGSE